MVVDEYELLDWRLCGLHQCMHSYGYWVLNSSIAGPWLHCSLWEGVSAGREACLAYAYSPSHSPFRRTLFANSPFSLFIFANSPPYSPKPKS
jgi:hypothetical protein